MASRMVVIQRPNHGSCRYCIPMDKLDRAIQRSEERFFEECDPGNSKPFSPPSRSSRTDSNNVFSSGCSAIHEI